MKTVGDHPLTDLISVMIGVHWNTYLIHSIELENKRQEMFSCDFVWENRKKFKEKLKLEMRLYENRKKVDAFSIGK